MNANLMKGRKGLCMGMACFGWAIGTLGAQEFVDDEQPYDRNGSAEEALGRYFESVDKSRPKTPFEKIHRNTLLEFAPIVESARASTLKVFKGERVRALATVVAREGLIITKASEIEDDSQLAVQLPGREEMLPAELIEVNEKNDLALLWVHDFNLTPVDWAPGSQLPIGSFVAASGNLSLPLAIGVVGLPLRNLSESDKGFLGVGLAEAKDGSGVFITTVKEGSGAADAGIEQGDLILAIDGVPMRTAHDLQNTIAEQEPGDVVVIQILRDEEERMVEVTLGDKLSGLGYRMPMHEMLDNTARMGGQVSRKRSGYPAAIQHDMLLKPTQCGGPLVNLDGKVVGINIARASRVKSYAIPSEVIQEWLGDPNQLAVKVLQTRVKNAEAARVSAEEALEAARALEADVQAALTELEERRDAAAKAAQEDAISPPEEETSSDEAAAPVETP